MERHLKHIKFMENSFVGRIQSEEVFTKNAVVFIDTDPNIRFRVLSCCREGKGHENLCCSGNGVTL